ncbi:kelch-like protein 4 [Eurosta solidaginis]|uniref:kelch-like protein 4 n=1 Tax=Eurosta solidaginis TaxID=178769 RepID=UPI003530AAF0
MQIKKMITPRSFFSAVVLNGKIYVMGGYRDAVGLKCVECYDPTKNSRSQCADMHKARASNGSTAQSDKWTQIHSLDNALQLTACISIDNQLWVFGGGDRHYRDFVSVYDDQNDKWINKKSLPLSSSYYCFTVPKALFESYQSEKKK